MTQRSLWLFAILVAFAACSGPYQSAPSDAGEDASKCSGVACGAVDAGLVSSLCTPGATVSCYCSGAPAGTATCASNGSSFGACQCAPPVDSGGGCAQPCNGACCATGEICITTNGIEGCAQLCAVGSVITATCSGSTPCCAALSNGGDAGSTWNGQGACLAAPVSPNAGQCLCTTSSECPGGVCTPKTGYYTCQPNSGAFWEGCAGSVTCQLGSDCVADCRGNEWCAGSPASNCTGGWCVVNPPASSCHNAVASCSDDCMLCSCE